MLINVDTLYFLFVIYPEPDSNLYELQYHKGENPAVNYNEYCREGLYPQLLRYLQVRDASAQSRRSEECYKYNAYYTTYSVNAQYIQRIVVTGPIFKPRSGYVS